MGTQKSQGLTKPSHKRLPRFGLRSQRKKESVIQGKLRIRSIPGAFLVLGMVVVIVGTALAVAGYWPYRVQRSAVGEVGDGLSAPSQASEWSIGAKGVFTSSLIHSERMKLLGPVIMGVGLFILICANTVLYENRDRETQMLLAQMQSVICSVSTALPSADITQLNSLARQYQWVRNLPAAHLNILCLQELASSEPLLQVKTMEEGGGLQQKAMLHTEVLHHQESSIYSSNSCNSSKLDFGSLHSAEHGASSALQPQPVNQCKLSNCLTASSLSTLEGEDLDLTAVPPRRSHSMTYRTNPHTSPKALVHLEKRAVKSVGPPRHLSQQSSSEVCINMPRVATMTLDLTPVEEQRHRSWPWLDLGYSRKYLKLESKEDSVDKMLDQLEQHCSQLEHNFGSGPFQRAQF